MSQKGERYDANMNLPGVQTASQKQLFNGIEECIIEPSRNISSVAAHVMNSGIQPIDVGLDDSLLVMQTLFRVILR